MFPLATIFTWQIEVRSRFSVLWLLASFSMTEEMLRVIVTSVTMSLVRLESVLKASSCAGLILGSVSLKVNI